MQKERGKIILVASHHEEDIRLLCDEVYWLKDGILERIEDISEYTRFKEAWVKTKKRIEELQAFSNSTKLALYDLHV